MIASFSLLSEPELKALAPELTVFLFSMGGLEQHGPHLPLGTKLIQAEEWSKSLAETLQTAYPLWNFILMPLLPLSVDSITNRVALNVRPHVVRDAIVDQCEELKRIGFLKFAVISSHRTPKQLSAIEDAAKIVSRGGLFSSKKPQLISVSSALVESKAVWDSPMVALPEEHAGEHDTGLLLKWNATLVSDAFKNLESVSKPKASITRFVSYLKNEIDGYWGNPSVSNPERAIQGFQSEISKVAEKMKPWLEYGKGTSLFKSGYRYFPLNGSFFKAYFLALIFFVMMLIWVIWGVKDVFEK